jgi:hypothetical protein
LNISTGGLQTPKRNCTREEVLSESADPACPMTHGRGHLNSVLEGWYEFPGEDCRCLSTTEWFFFASAFYAF